MQINPFNAASSSQEVNAADIIKPNALANIQC